MSSATDNDFKAAYAIRTFFLYLLVAFLAGRVTVNCQITFGIFCTYQLWNLLWIKILTQSENIYSIRVETSIIPDWIPLSIPKSEALKIRKDRVVTSISELSGIRGTHMMIALRIMSALISTFCTIAIQADLHHRSALFLNIKTSEDLVPVFLFMATIGQFFVGHFELNHVDKFHTTFHYIGVLLMSAGMFSVGFALRWSAFSKIILSTYYVIFIGWTWFCAKCPKKSNDIRVVTWNSKMCIGIELLMFQVYNIAIMSTVYSFGANEGNLFASPFL